MVAAVVSSQYHAVPLCVRKWQLAMGRRLSWASIALRLAGFPPRPAGAPGQDEYSDDDDPGYWREPVRRQDAFVLTELKHSDDESSPVRRAYHRWPAGNAQD